jgi:hypothetical protein
MTNPAFATLIEDPFYSDEGVLLDDEWQDIEIPELDYELDEWEKIDQLD